MARHARIAPRSSRRPVVAGALTILLSLGLGGFATSALFTDTAAVDQNVFSSGTLDLASDKTTLLSVTNLLPGDVLAAPLTLSNSGTSDLRYSLRSVTTEDTLAGALTVEIRSRSAADGNCTAFDGVPLYSGPLGNTAGINLLGSHVTGAQVGDRVIGTDGSDRLCFRITLPFTADNTMAQRTTTATLTFDAEQTRNNGPVWAAPSLTGSTTTVNMGMEAASITVPAGVSNTDLGVLVVSTSDNKTNGVSASGWVSRVANPAGQNNSAVSVLTRLGGLKAGDRVDIPMIGLNNSFVSASWYQTGGRDVTATSTGTRNASSLATVTIPSVDVPTAGSDVMVVSTERTLADGTILTGTTPSTVTQQFFREEPVNIDSSHYVANFAQPTRGATGPFTVTYNTASGNGVGALLVLGQHGTSTTAPVAGYAVPMVTAYEHTVLADNPVGYWPLVETEGSTVAHDLTGNDRHGTYYSDFGNALTGRAPLTRGSTGSAEFYGGSLAFPSLPISSAVGAPVTVEFWTELPNHPYDSILFSLGQPNLTLTPSGRMGFNTGDDDYLTADVSGLLGTKVHVVAVMSSSSTAANYAASHRLYINGVPQPLHQTGTPTPRTLSTSLRISGWNGQDQSRLHDTAISDVAVYNRELPAARVSAHYHTGLR